MQLWKLALSLALLAGSAPFAAAQQHLGNQGGASATTTPAPPNGGITPEIIVPGKWVVVYKWKGKVTSHMYFDDGTSIELDREWSEDGSDVDGYGWHEDWDPLYSYSYPWPTGVDSSTLGTVTAVYVWLADFSSFNTIPQSYTLKTPPHTLTVLEQPDAWAYGSPSSSADDGMGDPALPVGYWDSGRLLYSDGVESGGQPFGYGPPWKTSHLTTHQASSGVVRITHSLYAASAIIGAQPDAPIASVSYQAPIDTRTLSLKRDGARGETYDADGTGHGDTIYSYHTLSTTVLFHNRSDVDNINWQTFHPIYGGEWSKFTTYDNLNQAHTFPDISYSWTPSESDNKWNIGLWSIVHGAMNEDLDLSAPLKWTKDASPPGGGTETYTATDNVDGASATANYILKIHEPLELQGDEVVLRQPENYRTAPGAAWVISPQDGSDLNVYLENSVGWTVGGTVGGDIDIAEWARLSLALDISRQTTVNVGQGVTIHNVLKDWGCYAQIFDVYDIHSGIVKEWDEYGFLKDASYSLKIPSNPSGGITASTLIYIGPGSPPKP